MNAVTGFQEHRRLPIEWLMAEITPARARLVRADGCRIESWESWHFIKIEVAVGRHARNLLASHRLLLIYS